MTNISYKLVSLPEKLRDNKNDPLVKAICQDPWVRFITRTHPSTNYSFTVNDVYDGENFTGWRLIDINVHSAKWHCKSWSYYTNGMIHKEDGPANFSIFDPLDNELFRVVQFIYFLYGKRMETSELITDRHRAIIDPHWPELVKEFKMLRVLDR